MKSTTTKYEQNLANTSSRWMDRVAKKLIFKLLAHIKVGSLRVDTIDGSYEFGEPSDQARICAKVVVHDDSVYKDVLFNGTVGSGEAYMCGSWSSPDLVCVIRLMCANMSMISKMDGGFSTALKRIFGVITHRLRANSKQRAKLNIAAHYDLGNDFFKLFLDDTMMYSSAIYPRDDSSLQEAAIYKLEHICQRLNLQTSDHLLEVGSGWGGMAIYAAKHYGCRVTTTTISQEQFDYAVQAVEAEGLSDQITVLLHDYRDLTGQFDKIVSIEMIEAVGHKFYSTYFAHCSRLLKPNGLMLIQAITIADQRYEEMKKESDFIQRYIFPGGELPSLNVISNHIRKDTDMQIVGVEDITLDYAKTLRHWRERFFDRIEEVRAQQFNETFIKMWDFYLCYCEGGFLERVISTVQLLFAKPQCNALPRVSH